MVFHAKSTLDFDIIEIDEGRRAHLVERLGKGTLSTVYRAVLESQHGVCREVALKLFHAIASDEADHVALRLGEAASRAACVRHPNVASVYEMGFAEAQPFFLEELVQGTTLATLMERYAARDRRMPTDVALFIATEMAEALNGARMAVDHDGVQLGILHLGLTAREVLLSWRGEVKVADFEVSIARGATSSVRSLRAVAARAATMAPEVAQGNGGDARSDVFALGVLVRELFVGPRFPKTLSNHDTIRLAREGWLQPTAIPPTLGKGLEVVIDRALQVDPEDRYPNASAMAFELRRVALAMGVGDGRWFLRRALDREFGSDSGTEEVTKERG
ncbi:MAG TPA: serine/threonine-protein kinase [Labilithrix sp.]|jgi:serine/threonine-protein kinase